MTSMFGLAGSRAARGGGERPPDASVAIRTWSACGACPPTRESWDYGVLAGEKARGKWLRRVPGVSGAASPRGGRSRAPQVTDSLESLGLAAGDTFRFDVATTGGADGGSSVDLLSTDAIRPGWGFDEDSTLDLTYTVAGSTVVPGIGGIAALAGLGLGRRRRNR